MALGLNQAAFCKMLGLNSTAWNNYEGGVRRISMDAAFKVCVATGVTLDWIYLGIRSGLPLQLATAIIAAERGELARERVGRRA